MSFNSDAYMTRGFQREIPEIDKLFLLAMINEKSALPDNEVDYLQVFNLTRELVGNTVFQKIENTQEVPPSKSEVSFPLPEAVTAKVFCIDSEEYFTFMLAEEY